MFLAAGSVIHGMGEEQDMRRMGGLRKVHAHHLLDVPRRLARHRRHPALRRLLVGTTSSCSPGGTRPVLWVVGLVTALLTAFYASRLMFPSSRRRPAGTALPRRAATDVAGG